VIKSRFFFSKGFIFEDGRTCQTLVQNSYVDSEELIKM
jgi:hypothetical protein